MALNHADRIAVRQNIVNRCTSAVVQYALYLLGNQTATTDQLTWAREAIRSPGSIGDQVAWHVMDHPDFIDLGSGITDVALQGAVEAAINNRFIQAA